MHQSLADLTKLYLSTFVLIRHARCSRLSALLSAMSSPRDDDVVLSMSGGAFAAAPAHETTEVFDFPEGSASFSPPSASILVPLEFEHALDVPVAPTDASASSIPLASEGASFGVASGAGVGSGSVVAPDAMGEVESVGAQYQTPVAMALDPASMANAHIVERLAVGGRRRAEAVADVAPCHSRLVLFFADERCPHEVLPVTCDERFAVTLWFKGEKLVQ